MTSYLEPKNRALEILKLTRKCEINWCETEDNVWIAPIDHSSYYKLDFSNLELLESDKSCSVVIKSDKLILEVLLSAIRVNAFIELNENNT